jgi:outer membrane receptor protein involved in Fe transport
VSDPSGAAINGASLTLTEIGTGLKTVSKSDAAGLAVYGSLKPGDYTLLVAATGFQNTQLSGISVSIGQRLAVTATMQIGAITQTVNVSAASETMLNSESASVGQVISEDSIEELPLNGRNFVQLTQLSTGATPVGTGTSPSTTWTGRSDTTISLAGLRESDTSYLVNGIETRNARFGNTGLRPSIDAIQEFRVQRTVFGAEFGHSAGVVNVALLSGSNQYHMVLFELNRNTDYAAKGYFAGAAAAPKLNQNNFGSTFAGPLSIPHLYDGKNKSFFMFNFEGFRLVQGNTLQSNYPSAAQLAGNLADDSTGMGAYPTTSPFCLANSSSEKCIDIINPLTGLPFPGNVIPSGQISAFANAYITNKWIPTPNVSITPGQLVFPGHAIPGTSTTLPNNTNLAPDGTQDINQYNARIDHHLTQNDTIYGTWSDSNDNKFSPSIQPTGGLVQPLSDRLWTATWVHIFNPSIFNEFRFGYNDSKTYDEAQTANTTNIALNTFNLSYASSNPFDFGVPASSIGGFGGLGSQSEVIGAEDKNLQFTDNVSFTRGAMTIVAGGEFIHEKFDQITDFSSLPNFGFGEGYSAQLAGGVHDSGFGLADFLLGEPYSVGGATGDSEQQMHTNYYGFYGQDNWKVTPELTLNLGVRYEFAATPIESRNHSILFDPTDGQFFIAGQTIQRSIVDPDRNNWAPRIGFAYRPKFLKNTVVRGGGGIYYSTDNFNELQFDIAGSPFYVSQSAIQSHTTPASIYNPFGSNTQTFPEPGANIFTLVKTSRTPYQEQWGLSVQREFGANYLVEVEYAGGAGRKLGQRYNANIASFDPTQTLPYASRVPYPNYGFILVSGNYGRSNYNGLGLKFEKRFSGGSSFLAAYTYSKAIDIGTTDDFSALSRDFFTYDRGPSDYDVPQRLVVSYVYALPLGRGQALVRNAPRALDYVIGGWQLNGITTFTAGQFTTPSLSYDNMNIGTFSSNRPDKVGNPKSGRHGLQYWNPAAYASPSLGLPGDSGRNSLENPGYQNWDASLFKAMQIHERAQFQLRFEAFNAFNHTMFQTPNATIDTKVDGGGGFGVINSARQARVVQVGGRFTF